MSCRFAPCFNAPAFGQWNLHRDLFMHVYSSTIFAVSSFRAGVRSALRFSASVVLVSSAWITPSSAQGFQPMREQTTLDITITAADDLNRDEKERAAPVLVHFYELRSSARFESADYFSLQSDDRAALGGDLLRSEEFILRPGEQKRIRRKSHPDVEAVALMVGYRELAQADWRAVRRLDPAPEAAWYRMPFPANRLKLAVQLQRQGIQVVHVD